MDIVKQVCVKLFPAGSVRGIV